VLYLNKGEAHHNFELDHETVPTMEKRRFFEARGEERDEWLVLDGKRYPPRVICKCVGWNAPKNAALIAAALEAHNSKLYSKFTLGGSALPNEQLAVEAPDDAELGARPRPRSTEAVFGPGFPVGVEQDVLIHSWFDWH
jgi:hypothetical protein